MDNNVFANVSWLELCWMIVMAVGLGISIYNVWDGFKDKRAMKLLGVNGVSEVLVNSTITQDVSRTIQFMLLLGLGIFAACAPRIVAPEVHGFFFWYRIMSFTTILGVGVLLSFNAINARLSARKALQMSHKRTKGGE